MSEVILNIFSPREIACLKDVLDEVTLSLPEQQRSCALKAAIAEKLLKFAASGEKDPIRLKEYALRVLNSV